MATEVLVTLFGVLGTIVAGVMYILKRESDARATKMQAAANSQITDAQVRVKHAEVELKEAEAKIEIAKTQEVQLSQMMKMLSDQLRINEAWLKQLEQKEKTDERNYQVLKKLDDDNTKYLSAQIVESNRTLATVIEQIPAKIELLNVEAVRIMAGEIGERVAVKVAAQVAGLMREMRDEWKAEDAAEMFEKKAAEPRS